jgi:hypothetical protein
MQMTSRKSPPFIVTERDFRIKAIIARCGGLTAEQIGAYHFTPTVIRVYRDKFSREVDHLEVVVHANCQRRLKLLKDNGYVRRIERYQLLSEGKKPYLYTLTRFGAQTLAAHLNCTVEETGWRERETRLRPNYIEHHIKINDIRLAFMRAVEQVEGITLVAWRDELELTKIHSQFTIPLKVGTETRHEKLFPDACVILRGRDNVPRYAFIEYDGGTETTESRNDEYRTFAHKMRLYKSLIFKNKDTNEESPLRKHYGIPTARVLTVTTSSTRRDRLVEVSERVECERVFWFSTHGRITTPSIVEYGKNAIANGVEGMETAYRAVLPNILSDPIWRIAADKDPTRPDHALDEPFKLIRE